MNLLYDFGRFWWEFVVGDEWRIAVIVTVVTALGALAASGQWVDGEVIACTVAVVIMTAMCAVVISAGWSRARRGNAASNVDDPSI